MNAHGLHCVQGVEANTSDILSAVEHAVGNVHTLVDSLSDRPTDCATIALHEGVEAASCDIYRTVDRAASQVREAIGSHRQVSEQFPSNMTAIQMPHV